MLVDVLRIARPSISTSWARTWPARWSLIAANIWRGIPFVAISLLAGLQTISPSLYEAALLDGSTAWQRFRFITFPLLMPILAIVMTFSIIFTFTDFQLVYAITRGGPVNSTHLMATLAFQRGIPGGAAGRGRGDRRLDDPVPGRRHAVQLLRAWRAASGSREKPMTDARPIGPASSRRTAAVAPEQMAWDSRARRMVTIYMPLALLRDRAAVPVLLDGDHGVQTERRAVRLQEVQSVLDRQPTLRPHQASCCSRPPIRAG